MNEPARMSQGIHTISDVNSDGDFLSVIHDGIIVRQRGTLSVCHLAVCVCVGLSVCYVAVFEQNYTESITLRCMLLREDDGIARNIDRRPLLPLSFAKFRIDWRACVCACRGADGGSKVSPDRF